jgi:transmembrane sensor
MNTSIPPFNDPNASPDDLREEARIWLHRLTGGAVTPSELQAFKRWQRSSAAHEAAFEEAKRQWKSIGPVLGDILHADPKRAARHDRMMNRREPQLGRRAFLGAAVSAAGVAGVAVLYPPARLWLAPDEWGADYRTATGEQRVVALADRASVTLNTQTSIRKQMVGDEITGMDLIAGEAAIDLPNVSTRSGKDGKPFSVAAGAGRSSAESGRFEVRYLDGKVCVTCVEGAVKVEHPAGARMLQARQQTVYDANSLSGVAAIEPADISAWRSGELVFNQTPLVQVVDEINRYRPGRVVLMTASKHDRALTGRFRIAVLDEALLQIQHAFALDARSLPGGLVVLS